MKGREKAKEALATDGEENKNQKAEDDAI